MPSREFRVGKVETLHDQIRSDRALIFLASATLWGAKAADPGFAQIFETVRKFRLRALDMMQSTNARNSL